MKVVVILERSGGNEQVGDMWLETKVFDATDSLESVLQWAKDKRVSGKTILTIPDDQETPF